jgi:hypothetical protein
VRRKPAVRAVTEAAAAAPAVPGAPVAPVAEISEAELDEPSVDVKAGGKEPIGSTARRRPAPGAGAGGARRGGGR